MKQKIRCDQCGKIQPKDDTYLFNGQTYCYECGICLVFALADYGTIYIDFEDGEEKCNKVNA